MPLVTPHCVCRPRSYHALSYATLCLQAEKKAYAAALKEGGKKGQDLIGMCDLGGMKYFTVAMEKCAGRWDLLEAAMKGANKIVDESKFLPLLHTLYSCAASTEYAWGRGCGPESVARALPPL